MLVPLFGFLEDDYLGRVIVTPSNQTIGQLALQLRAWSDGLPGAGACEVTDEAGDVLDPAWTVERAGLTGGGLFRVRPL
jgi:hypothetical protein